MPIIFKAMAPSLAASPAVPGAPGSLNVTSTLSTSIGLSWSSPNPAATTYNLYRNNSLVRTGIVGNTVTDTGLTPATQYLYYVTGVNAVGEGPASNTVQPTTTSSQQMKWNPGHYLNLPTRVNAGDSSNATNNSIIDIAKASGNNVAGVFMKFQWPLIQGSSSTTYDWSVLDAYYMRIAYTNGIATGKRMIVQFLMDAFTTNPASCTPAFILNNPATYGPGKNGTQGGYWTINSGSGVVVAVWRPNVMNAVLAMYQAFSTHVLPDGFTVDNSPFIEQVQTWEIASPAGADTGSGFTAGQYLSSLESLIIGANSAFSKTVMYAEANFCNDATTTLNLVNFMQQHRWGGGGPDMFGYTWLTGQSPFGGSLNKLTFGQQCFSGINTTTYPVGTPGFSDLRGLMPWSNECEDPELVGFAGQFAAAPWVPLDIDDTVNKILSKPNNTGGITHMHWQWISGSGAATQDPTTFKNTSAQPGNWATQVLGMINSRPIPYTGYPANLP